MVALSAWTTIDRLHRDPQRVGLAATLTARTDGSLSDRAAGALLESDPEVAAAYPGVEVAALVPGQTSTIALRGLGTRQDPCPYALAEGRAATGPTRRWPGRGCSIRWTRASATGCG